MNTTIKQTDVMINPLVSICSITYNHANYIKQCIEGFLMQKTNFPIEILIHDDASNDGTIEILQEYKNQYPDLLQIIVQDENQYSKGINPFSEFVAPQAQGKYIAVCEGDDYWTDPYKLQKQVDFLEKYTEYTMSFHNAIVKWDDHSKPDSYFCPIDQKPVSTIEDVIKGWFIPSASMVFRRDEIIPLPDWFSYIYNGDWALQLLVASKGKIAFLNSPMSVYRKSLGSLSSGVGKNNVYVNEKKIILLQYFDKHTKYIYSHLIVNQIMNLTKETKVLVVYQKMPLLKYLNWKVWIRKIINVLNSLLNF